jgi:DNA-directed RNA polymerase specialized sigma24 family protein
VVRDADLRRALAGLGDEERLAVYVFFYLDLPLEEAAAVLGLSVPAARSRIYRAARRLRPSLELDEVVR